jgi:hypothetical protein
MMSITTTISNNVMMSFKLYLFQCTVSIYPKYLFTASSPIIEKVIPEAAMQNNYQ